MALSAVILVWRKKTYSSTSRDSVGTSRKTVFGNYCKTLSAIQRSDRKLWPFSAVIPVWRGKTNSSTSSDSIRTSRKTGSGNYCKPLSTIQRSDQKLWPFSAVIPVWRGKTNSSTSSDSIRTSRKTGSGNYCKTLSAIQRSDQKLSRHPTVASKVMALSAVILVWHKKTYSSTNRDSIGTSRKTGIRNNCKTLSAIQRSHKKLWPFQLLFWSGTRRPTLQRVGIP